VARSEVDPVYLDKPYFIVPDDKVGQEAFGVIREAMRQRGVAGIARVALHGRERLILLEPRANGIMGTTLHHNYEVRSDSVYFDDIPDLEIGEELLDLASHIIETKKASFNPEKFKDRYQDAVVDLIHSSARSYRCKRDFSKTIEPSTAGARPRSPPIRPGRGRRRA
jgi:DNA end-binding protein Ku